MTSDANSHSYPKTVYLVDASIYIFQAHFSPYVECYSNKQSDLSAVFGFMQFLMQFIRRVKPSHLAIARDESLFTGFRHQLSPDYKSNRELPDENLAAQLEACAAACDALGLPHFASQVYEADDIIGTLARKLHLSARSDFATCIVSKDKDLAQLLLNERSYLWDYSGNRRRYRQDIINDYGVYPEQFPDYLGLIGDSVDVISGVPGIGPVKAKALLEKYNSIEALYQCLDELHLLPLRGAKTLANVLQENTHLAELSKALATIDCDVSDPEESFSTTDYDDLERREPNESSFRSLLRDMDFQETEADSLIYQFGKLQSI